jgi:hypothetical protein
VCWFRLIFVFCLVFVCGICLVLSCPFFFSSSCLCPCFVLSCLVLSGLVLFFSFLCRLLLCFCVFVFAFVSCLYPLSAPDALHIKFLLYWLVSCLVLFVPVACPLLSFLIVCVALSLPLSSLTLSFFLVLLCLVWSCLVMSCHVLSCFVLSYLLLVWYVLPSSSFCCC